MTNRQSTDSKAPESLGIEMWREYVLMVERCRKLEMDIVRLKGWILERDNGIDVGDPFSPELPEDDDE